MKKIRVFAPITKINESTREVEGILGLEVKDKEGEIMDYTTSKEYIQKWSSGIEKASGGKSKGNVREMHRRISAGVIKDIEFDDEKKQVRAVTKVINDSTWEKILEGGLNGFSFNGDAVRRWNDKVQKAKRYTIFPDEVSYVDNPCMYGADFTAIRGDGVTEIRKFAGGDDDDLDDDDMDFVNVEDDDKLSKSAGSAPILSALREISSKLEKLSIQKGDDMGDKKKKVADDDNEEEVEQLTKDDVVKIAKGQVKLLLKSEDFKDALKEVMDEVTEDLQQSMQQIAKTVTKIANSPARAKVVTKVVDGKRRGKADADDDKTDDDDDDGFTHKKKMKKTSDREDLVGLMKIAQKKSVPFFDDDEEEATDDDEADA